MRDFRANAKIAQKPSVFARATGLGAFLANFANAKIRLFFASQKRAKKEPKAIAFGSGLRPQGNKGKLLLRKSDRGKFLAVRALGPPEGPQGPRCEELLRAYRRARLAFGEPIWGLAVPFLDRPGARGARAI